MRKIVKEQEETFGNDRCVHSLDYGDGFTSVKMYQIVHFKHTQLIVLYTSKSCKVLSTTRFFVHPL